MSKRKKQELNPPDEKAIAAEIQALKELKPTMRRFSAFGDDHWLSVDAQIEVLQRHLSPDACYERSWANTDVESAAREAAFWLEGHTQDEYGDELNPPSHGWASLNRK